MIDKNKAFVNREEENKICSLFPNFAQTIQDVWSDDKQDKFTVFRSNTQLIEGKCFIAIS